MIFYLTFGDLATWLSLAPLKRLIEDTGIQIDFVPMIGSLGNVVPKAKPGEDDPLEAYKARRARARNKATERELARMSEILQIPVENAQRKIDPTMLSIGLLWLKQHRGDCLDFLDLAFRRTYLEVDDVESEEAIVAILKTLDVPDEGFAASISANKELLETQADELLESGILSAPAFLLEGEIFHGREHLPLITWMLKGRQGPPPV